MANEIQLISKFTVRKGFINLPPRNDALNVTWIGSDYRSGTIELTNDWTILSFSEELLTLGWARFRNLASAGSQPVIELATVEDAEYGGHYSSFGEIYPGEFPSLRLTQAVYAARSMGADVLLEYQVLEK